MPKFKVVDEGDSFFTIQGVPIFEMHTDRGFPCDATWMNAAIKNHAVYKEGGHRPTIIIGHNVKGQEKESVGFLDQLVLKGKRLYADLVRVPRGIKEKIVRNSFPSRSVEILPKSQRILTLALLGGTTPHFPLPQMSYEEDNGETHLFFRSPEMEMTEEMKKEIFAQVGEAVASSLPTAFEKFFKSDGDGANEGDEPVAVFTDEAGQQYAVPAALAAVLKGAGKVASKVAGTVAKHPGHVAAGAGGFVAGRATKRKYAAEGYQISEETGEVYLDGELIGVVITYEDMQAAGMKVPTAVKKPDALPKIKPVDPQLAIDASAVGVGSGNVAAGETAPGAIAGDLVQPLDRAESAQFESELDVTNYELLQAHARIDKLETANALITEGRRAEEYTKWLESQRTAGVPVGDIEKTVDFMMSLEPEQVESHKALLLSQPKVAFAKAEEIVNFSQIGDASEAAIKQDYEQNKAAYQAMGVNDKDLKYVPFVRINRGVGERQPG